MVTKEVQKRIDEILKASKLPLAVLKAIKRGTWHWTAGLWWQKQWTKIVRGVAKPHKPYHFVVTYNKGKAKAEQVLSVGVIGEHTYNRNTGNVGLSYAGMGKDKEGKTHAIRNEQIEVMAKLTAELSLLFNWDLAKESEHVQPHYYWATIDGYGPGSGHPETRVDCMGYDDITRQKAVWYRAAIIRGETRKAQGLELGQFDHLFEHTVGMF